VLLTHKIPDKGLNLLKEKFDVLILDTEESIEHQLHHHLPTADYLIPLLSVPVDKALLKKCSKLRAIANYAVGYNNIDIEEANKQNILVTNTPDVLTNATADLVWGLILALTRRILEGDQICRQGDFTGWLPEFLLGSELSGKVLGIIGMGRIGKAVAKRALGFEMKVQYYSRTEKKEFVQAENISFVPELHSLLKNSDIISVNVPYTSSTHHMIGEQEFMLMKRSSYLINTARGRIVDEKALIHALEEKHIAGAALDVFYDEPEIPPELRKLSNLVMTPHIGSATHHTREAMAVMVAENIIAIENGEIPPNLIPEMKKGKD
jgi:glyoxylate reductase